MILNTLIVWVVTFALLAAIVGIGALFIGGWVVVLPIQLIFLAVPAACMVCGIMSAMLKGNLLVSVGIALFWTLLAIYFSSGNAWGDFTLFLRCLPLCSVLLSFILTKLIIFIAGGNFAFLNAVLLPIGAIAVFCVFYTVAASLSVFAYSFFREDTFFSYPVDPSLNFIEGKDGKMYMAEKSGDLFTGVKYTYSRKLNISPFPPKIVGVYYYVNGRYYGRSGGGFINCPGTSGAYSDKSCAEYKKGVKPEKPFLYHKDYEVTVKKLVEGWGDYYFEKIKSENHTDSEYAAVLTEENGLPMKRLIRFHPNGLVYNISKAYFSIEKGWDYYDDYKELSSDSLGFMETCGIWDKDDFKESVFDTEAYISQNATKNEILVKKLTRPEKFDYIPHPEKSIHKGLFDNMVFGYDMPNENNKVGFYILNSDGEYLWAGNDFDKIIDFYDTGKLGIDSVNADFHSASDFKDGGVEMMIVKSGGDKKMYLWYNKGIFYINNGPYYVDTNCDSKNKADYKTCSTLRKDVERIFAEYKKKRKADIKNIEK